MNAIEWLRDCFSHDDFWSYAQLVTAWSDEHDRTDEFEHALIQFLDDGELGKCDDIYYRTEKFLDPNERYYTLSDAGFNLANGESNGKSKAQ